MCGIAGIMNAKGTPPNEGDLQRLSKAVAHRGPDAHGMWIEGGIGLVHRRLAIIDLSERGTQPMHSADGRFVITYNGEVYNYIELKQELESLGSSFHSNSDTEVILESYRRWGADAVKRFRGMFAFAIWDREKCELFFARDVVGKKPFFYRTLADGSFAFASELKALRLVERVDPDPSALRLFFGMQYVPSPLTGFLNVFSLPPGHRGFVTASGVRTERYHSWDDAVDPPSPSDALRLRGRSGLPASEFADRRWQAGHPVRDVRDMLDEAIRLRLRADVTIGAMLSGGIDSAAVVGLAQKHLSRAIRTFTMGFPNIGMDERKEAKAISELFGTDHQEFVARPEDLIAMTEQLIFHYGAPYADSSALPVMMLSREIAKEIKVVLVGDGGDELFGGYRRYRAYRTIAKLAKFPGGSSAFPPPLHLVADVLHDVRYDRMADSLRAAKKCLGCAYGELFCGAYFDTAYASRCLRKDFLTANESSEPIEYICQHMGKGKSAIGRAMRFDFESYLPDDLNVKMDRATMAYSLEARAPFLDSHLVSYVLNLPTKLHFSGRKGKMILKHALADLLPDEVLNRPKRGFQVPLAEWFRADPLASYWKDRCLDPASPLSAYVKQDAIKELFEENLRGMDHGNRLWMLLSLAVWLDGISHE
ncbi:MAG: asparagine synthase (glutamine-hydrolyzing) [Patescibacteria group bacterium]